MKGDMGHMGGLINPRPWHGRCQTTYSNTSGPPLPWKRAPCKKIVEHDCLVFLLTTKLCDLIGWLCMCINFYLRHCMYACLTVPSETVKEQHQLGQRERSHNSPMAVMQPTLLWDTKVNQHEEVNQDYSRPFRYWSFWESNLPTSQVRPHPHEPKTITFWDKLAHFSGKISPEKLAG